MLINSLPVRHFFFFTFTSLCLKLDDPDFVYMRVCTCVCIYRRARLREIFAVWADGGEVGAPTCHFGWAALCWAAVAQRSRASYSGYPWERRAAARGQYHSVFRLYELMSLLAILSSLTHTHTHRAAQFCFCIFGITNFFHRSVHLPSPISSSPSPLPGWPLAGCST